MIDEAKVAAQEKQRRREEEVDKSGSTLGNAGVIREIYDGRNPKQPVWMYKTLVNNGNIFPISAG